MAFLDRLSKTVSEAGQKTIAKTKELADTTRLNSMISDEEKMINNHYMEMGKLYISLHENDFEEPFAGMISAIAEAQGRIEDYRRQIQEIKKVQRCENCGSEVANGAAFCGSCGATMPKIQAPEVSEFVKCTNCGTDVKRGMRFCATCGNPVEAEETSTGAGEAEESNASEANVSGAAQGKMCPNCGKQVEEGLSFCAECGAKI